MSGCETKHERCEENGGVGGRPISNVTLFCVTLYSLQSPAVNNLPSQTYDWRRERADQVR
jgi:hypothetical protein